jgi:hypothetical protein
MNPDVIAIRATLRKVNSLQINVSNLREKFGGEKVEYLGKLLDEFEENMGTEFGPLVISHMSMEEWQKECDYKKRERKRKRKRKKK